MATTTTNPTAVQQTPAAPAAPASTTGNSLSNYYAQSPGTQQVAATPPAAATTATATTQNVPDANLASSQLNDITSQDSPLMKQARQTGILSAAKRGLQNSSLSAGNSEAAAVQSATPLAQTNAQELQDQSLNNQNAQNSIAQSNASLQTQNSQFNADTTERANEQNAASQNSMRTAVLQANSDLNKQYLAGTQAMDLASIQGKYQQLISSNSMASDLYSAYFNSISQAMANKDITPDRIAQYVQVQQSMLQSGLQMMDAMNSTDLSNFSLPAVASAGKGNNSSVAATPTQGTPAGPTASTGKPNVPSVTVHGTSYPAGSTVKQVSFGGAKLAQVTGPDGKTLYFGPA